MDIGKRNLFAMGLLLLSCANVSAQTLQARGDVSLQILPRPTGPEIFNLDSQELIVLAPASKRPKGYDKTNEYEAVEALKQDGKPLFLWLRKDSNFRKLRNEDVYIEVRPKWKTNEATIFSAPGKSHTDCSAAAKVKPCIAWPVRGTTLRFLDTKLVESVDPADQLMKWRLFYQVQYKYTNRAGTNVQGRGWIFSEDVIVEERRAANPVPTPLENPKVNSGDQSAEPTVPAPPPTEVEKMTAQLAPHLGDCLYPGRTPIRLSNWNTSVSPAFTETLLPYWKNKKLAGPATVPALTFKGKKISQAQWVAIDTLARTIYGEMATCNFATGPVYLMAVAKVILNRVNESNECLGRKGLFMCIKPELSACKKLDQPEFVDDITQVLIKPFQFSTWNNNRRIDLRRVLCPPGREKEERQKNGKISNYEKFDVDNWQDSVKIAVEAILDEENFKRKTEEVTATFYVSGAARIGGHSRIPTIPSILGQKLDKGRCIKFMQPIKASARKCRPIPEEAPEANQ